MPPRQPAGPTVSLLILVAACTASPRAVTGEEKLLTRISDQLVAADEAWNESGFRVQLRFGKEAMLAGNTADAVYKETWYPDWSTGPNDTGVRLDAGSSGYSFAVEPGVRLNRYLSLSATMRYAVVLSGSGSGFGFRWTTTAEVTWHPLWGFFLSGGAGYGGMYYSDSRYEGDYDLSLSCYPGHGALGVTRLGYLFAIGELFATGPVFELAFQGTHCPAPEQYQMGGDITAPGDNPEPGPTAPPQAQTATELADHWWLQPTWTFSWSFAWR